LSERILNYRDMIVSRRSPFVPQHPLDNQTIAYGFDLRTLLPLIEATVEATITRLTADQGLASGTDRLCYSEAEAAELIGLNPHQLRDERLRGRVGHSRIVGNRVAYSREDLLRYLARCRVEAGSGRNRSSA
jgi:hypothetical protein